MKKIIKNISLINTISNLILQLTSMISAFIIPKIILSYFGSEVNGLVSSLSQFLSYIALLEGGITGVVMASLYKPLYNKDYRKINSIIMTTTKFYRKIGTGFIIYSIIIALVYPIIFNTSFSYIYISSLTLILSVGFFVQYNFSITLKTLLNADKKVYIVSFTQSLLIIINIILSIICVKVDPNIHLLKILTSLTYIIQPLIYCFFVNKYYKIQKNVDEDNEMLRNRWSGFAINIASFIHFNTDVTILTAFTNLKNVSIYSVYMLAVNGIYQLINSVALALAPSIGHIYVSRQSRKTKYNV